MRANEVLIALAGAYADGLQVDWSEALTQSQTTILRYLSAGHWPARAGAYHCEFRTIDGAGRKLEKVLSSNNDGWIIPREYWQIVMKSGAHLNANWHLGEFDLPPFQDEGGTYSGFARNVEFDRTYLPEQGEQLAAHQTERTGDAGRPEKGATLYLGELERRAQKGELESTLAAQARALQSWFRAEYPDRQAPGLGTIENRIRPFFPKRL